MEETLPNTLSEFSRLSLTPIQDTAATPATRTLIMHAESTKFSTLPSIGNEEEKLHDEEPSDPQSMTLQQLRDALEAANKKIQRLTTSHKRQARNNQRLQERYERAKADNTKNLKVIERFLVGFRSLRDLDDGEGDNRNRKSQDFDEEMELDDSGREEKRSKMDNRSRRDLMIFMRGLP
jgi:TolA-binding protein